MKENEILNAIYKNARMGVVGIESVKGYARSPHLRSELFAEKREYGKICQSAEKMLKERRETVKGISGAAQAGTHMLSRMKLRADSSDSKIASMMIQGSTTGVNKAVRSKRLYDGNDERIKDLSDKLLETEQNNIENLKSFI